MKQLGWVFVMGAAVALAGCGMKGPLFLPDKNASVVTRPGSANTTTTAPAEPGSTPAPVAPAPGDTAPGTPPQSQPPPQDKSKDDSQSSGAAPRS